MKKNHIYWVNLDPSSKGAEINKRRPCVVISPDEMNSHLKTVLIAPLTSAPRKLRTRIPVKASSKNKISSKSYIVLDQIKTIDKSRVLPKSIGEISKYEARKVALALKEMFQY